MPPIPEGQQAEAYHFGASHDAARPSSKKKLKKTLHQRHGDRSSGDDDAGDDAKLPVYCRFADLIEAGIATNWPQLLRMIDNQGFPEGIWLSANIRAWEVASVRRWLAERPTARKQIVKPYRQKEATAGVRRTGSLSCTK